jgi:protein TonB
MSRGEHARSLDGTTQINGSRIAQSRIVAFPHSPAPSPEHQQPAMSGANFWHTVAADNRKWSRQRMGYWVLAVAVHLAVGAMFLISLNREDERPIETAEIQMLAPPAPPHAEPPPPKPVEVKETPRPKPVVQRAIPKPIPRIDPPAPLSIPLPAVAPVPVEPPPPAPSHAAPPSYLGELYAHLAANKRYPRAAQLAHVQGTAILYFTMNHQGRVLNYRLDRSSGHADLDAEVLAMIQRAQPLPKPPADTPDPWELTIPVQFSVH